MSLTTNISATAVFLHDPAGGFELAVDLDAGKGFRVGHAGVLLRVVVLLLPYIK